MPDRKGPAKLAPADAPRSISHHLDAAGTDLAHAIRHTAVAKSTATGSTKANLNHAAHHAAKVQDKLSALAEAINNKVPGVAAETAKLAEARPKPAPKKPGK